MGNDALEKMHNLPTFALKGRERLRYIVGNCLATCVSRGARNSGKVYPDKYDTQGIIMDEVDSYAREYAGRELEKLLTKSDYLMDRDEGDYDVVHIGDIKEAKNRLRTEGKDV